MASANHCTVFCLRWMLCVECCSGFGVAIFGDAVVSVIVSSSCWFKSETSAAVFFAVNVTPTATAVIGLVSITFQCYNLSVVVTFYCSRC